MAHPSNLGPDFNSDDLDFGPQTNPWDNTNIGQKSINKIFEDADEDRISSKRTVKTLTPLSGAPQTRLTQSLWIRRFEAFRTGLQQPLDRPFSGDDVIRFFDSILSKMDTRFEDKPGPNVSTILTACKIVVCYGHFKWSAADGFTMLRHDSLRFRAWLDSAIKAGRLTRGKWQKKTWIGFATLSRIVRAYLERSISHGTDSWDIVVARCLSIVLTSSLSARGGDLARSNCYTGEEYLKYEDIELSLESDVPVFGNLRAQITVKYAKGRKDEYNGDTIYYLRPLDEEHQSHVCPIAWLIVHALRQSLVAGTTVQDVLDAAAARSDRRVTWLHPRRPVFSKFGSHRCYLDQVAGAKQLLVSIKNMGLVAGMVDRAYVHALRFGAARDLAHLPQTVFEEAGLTTEAVRQSIGHTGLSMRAGVTEKYVGGVSADLYNARAKVETIHRREPRFASSQGLQPLDLVKASVSEAEIEAAITASKARLGRTITRKAAITQARQTRFQALPENVELQARETQSTRAASLAAPSPLPPATGGRNARTPLAEKDVNARPATAPTSGPKPAPRNPTSDETIMVDPVLLDDDALDALARELPDAAFAELHETLIPTEPNPEPGVDNSLVDRSADDATLQGLDEANARSAVDRAAEDPDVQEMASILCGSDTGNATSTTTPVEWVARYAKYNIVSNAKFARLWRQHCVPEEQMPTGVEFDNIFADYCNRGGSRDEPTPIAFVCQVNGCPHKTIRLDELRRHEQTCDEARAVLESSGADALAAGEGIACRVEGCPFVVMPGPYQLQNLRTHISKVHKWEAKPCAHGCDPETVYYDYDSFKRHNATKHSPRWPIRCPYLGCKHTAEYNDTTALRNHLMSTHGVSKDDAPQYYPAVPARREWVPQACFVAGCKTSTEYKARDALSRHLKRAHGMQPDAAKAALDANAQYTDVDAPAPKKAPSTLSAKRARGSLGVLPTSAPKKAKENPSGDVI